jgi:MFS family permease
MMASLAGGLFMVGFASEVLNASALQIGILAALPLSANLAQLVGSLWLQKFGQRRKFCLTTVTAGRFLLLPVLALPFCTGFLSMEQIVLALILLVGISSFFAALAGVAWLEWMSDVIPSRVRGTYMARRNMVCAGSGMVAVILGGFFLDRWQSTHGGESHYSGYLILFAVGISLGFVASWILSRIPDPKAGPAPVGKTSFNVSSLLRPLQDANFRTLLIYVGAFMFVTQMAGPFYALFMLDELGISFSNISLFLTGATLASLFMWRIWGPMCDRLGNKPVLMVAGTAHAVIPLIWVTAVPGAAFLPLLGAHIASGMFYSAIQLGHVNILVKLSPQGGRSAYIAVFNGMIGLSTALAPIFGGLLLKATDSVRIPLDTFEFGPLHLLFLFSGLLQVIILPLLSRVAEFKSESSSAVMMQLSNDLNPQTGLASASDFVLVKKSKTDHLLKTVDSKTDDWAARSEKRIEAALDKLISLGHKYFGGIIKWIKEDS